MAITTTLLTDADIIKFFNLQQSIGISTIDADTFNLNFTNVKNRLNDLITQSIAESADNVKLTGNQSPAGVKTWQNNAKFAAGSGIGDAFLLINANGSGDSSIRFESGATDGALYWDETNQEFLLLTDSAILTALSRLNIAAGTSANEAVRFDQVILTTGAQSKAGLLTFTDTLPRSSLAPTLGTELINKTYGDGLVVTNMGIFQQEATPTPLNNALWIKPSTRVFSRGNGVVFEEIGSGGGGYSKVYQLMGG